MIPSLEMAQVIAAEWEKQHEIIDLGRMPLVRTVEYQNHQISLF